MRIAIPLVLLSLISITAHAETRIVEYPDRIVVEIIGERANDREKSVATESASSTSSLPQSQRTADREFIDPGSADYIRLQTALLQNELKELRIVSPGESSDERRQRLQRLNEKQKELQRHMSDLSSILTQAAKR